MATILVTGSCGGVGSWTVDRFAAAGHEVVGVDRRLPPSRAATSGRTSTCGT